MDKIEQKILTFLEKNFSKNPPEGSKLIPVGEIAAALKMELPDVKKALRNITKSDEEVLSIVVRFHKGHPYTVYSYYESGTDIKYGYHVYGKPQTNSK